MANKITRCGGADWLTAHLDRACKVSAKSGDIQALLTWNQSAERDPLRLREILGNIYNTLNEASRTFKRGSRNWTPQTAQMASEALPNIQNLPQLQAVIGVTERILSLMPPSPTTSILYSMAHGIRQAQFQPEQVEALRRIAQGGEGLVQQTFVEEADQDRMDQYLQTGIYSGGGDAEKAIKVLREILQNAVDATLQKPRKAGDEEPRIDLQVWAWPPYKSMDVMISDNGIGMDWATMSDKFFRYFVSGKEEKEGATGGFGIAKALIQETPQEGWTIDTNGLHSSRFGRNMYMGTPRSQQYQPPRSEIRQENGGTVLTLYGLPAAPLYAIEILCQKYAASGVTITLNGKTMRPYFLLNQLPRLDEDLKNLSEVAGKNDLERNIANEVVDEFLPKAPDVNLGGQTWETGDKQTSIQFAMDSKSGSLGKVMVFLNGQFQFDENQWLSKINLICDVRTTARPNDDSYPVDPGRGKLREPYHTYVQEIVEFLKQILEKISSNELFKQGLDITMFNKDFEPLNTVAETDRYDQERKIFKSMLTLGTTGLFEDKTEDATELAHRIEQSVSSHPELTPQQQAIVNSSVAALVEKSKSKIDVKEELDKIIDGLTTPAASIVQKNFVGKETIEKDPNLTASLVMLWQSMLKKVMDATNKLIPNRNKQNKQYVPGILFSDEGLGLFLPPQTKGGFYTIAINPISVAAIVEPKLYAERLTDVSEEVIAPIEEDKETDRRTADRLAVFLMHAAIHETAHLLYPDSYGSDRFHKEISKIEMACHFIYPEVRQETKSYLKDIRRQTQKMIRRVSKDRAKRQASAMSWVLGQCRFARL